MCQAGVFLTPGSNVLNPRLDGFEAQAEVFLGGGHIFSAHVAVPLPASSSQPSPWTVTSLRTTLSRVLLFNACMTSHGHICMYSVEPCFTF